MPALCMASLEKKKQEELQGGLQESEVGYIYSRKTNMAMAGRSLMFPIGITSSFTSQAFFSEGTGGFVPLRSESKSRVSRCQNRLNLSCIPQKRKQQPKTLRFKRILKTKWMPGKYHKRLKEAIKPLKGDGKLFICTHFFQSDHPKKLTWNPKS